MFNLFVSALKMQFSQQLPGKPAQQLLKPYLKISKALDAPVPYNAKKSAVMALLFPVDDEPYLLLIERNEYKGAHSGQLAFPGGKIEKGDTSYLATALRETYEEIGILSEQIEVLGGLTELYVLASNFLVYPYVGILAKKPDFNIDEREVKQILEIPVAYFLSASIKEKQIKSAIGIKLNAPYYDINGKTLWGATAMMISELMWMVKASGYFK